MEAAIRSNAPEPSRGLHYHASTHTSRAVVLQRDNRDHTLIEVQYSLYWHPDRPIQDRFRAHNPIRNQNKALHLSGDPVR